MACNLLMSYLKKKAEIWFQMDLCNGLLPDDTY